MPSAQTCLDLYLWQDFASPAVSLQSLCHCSPVWLLLYSSSRQRGSLRILENAVSGFTCRPQSTCFLCAFVSQSSYGKLSEFSVEIIFLKAIFVE